jgi:hypothetical protein
MANEVLLDEHGFIIVHYDGHQTVELMDKRLDEIFILIAQLRSESKPVLLLAEMNSPGDSSHEVRKMGVEAISKADYDKLAIYGTSSVMKNLFNFLLNVAGQHDRVGYFESRSAAVEWLQKKD